MRGLRLLQQYEVEYNVLSTVNRVNADYPLEVYRFLRDEVGTTWMQFIPVVERINEDGLTLYQEAEQLQSFLGFPPRQEPAAFNLDNVMEKMNEAAGGGMH